MAPFPVLAEGLGHRAVRLGEFRHHDGLRDKVGAGAALISGHGKRAKAQLGTFFDDFPIPGFAATFDLVTFQRGWQQHFLGEMARFFLPVALCFVQGEIHGGILVKVLRSLANIAAAGSVGHA